jgi:lipocalin
MFFYFIFYLLAGSFVNVESSCPPVSTVDNFNLTEYVRDRWYIQRQQVTNYLPIENNYCVSAKYSISNKKVPFYHGTVLDVYNRANVNGINGTNENKNNYTLCARIPDSNVSSKLLVAPCFLPNIFAGDYWVIDAGPSSNNYQYAIVSGGQPTIQLKDGCTTSTNGTNDSGFWFFTRHQNVNMSLINTMNEIAHRKGFSLKLMNNVTQLGCNYSD